jgi:hypothetical protein
MQLISNALAQECAAGGLLLGYWMYYYEAWVLPALLRQEKMQYAWSAAHKKYHENIWRLNHAYDRDLRYSAVSKNLLLEHINHTPPKVRALCSGRWGACLVCVCVCLWRGGGGVMGVVAAAASWRGASVQQRQLLQQSPRNTLAHRARRTPRSTCRAWWRPTRRSTTRSAPTASGGCCGRCSPRSCSGAACGVRRARAGCHALVVTSLR